MEALVLERFTGSLAHPTCLNVGTPWWDSIHELDDSVRTSNYS